MIKGVSNEMNKWVANFFAKTLHQAPRAIDDCSPVCTNCDRGIVRVPIEQCRSRVCATIIENSNTCDFVNTVSVDFCRHLHRQLESAHTAASPLNSCLHRLRPTNAVIWPDRVGRRLRSGVPHPWRVSQSRVRRVAFFWSVPATTSA